MRRKLYGIFKEVDGIVYGYIENSFSMSWSKTFVRAWTKEEIQKYIDSKQVPAGAYILRITRSELDMEFQWKAYHRAWRNARWGDGRKYFRRNIQFKMVLC